MKNKTVKVASKNGIHMRPAVELVDEALQFNSNITLETKNGKANAKSIMEVTMLGMTKGTKVMVTAEGPDEEEAINTIVEVIKRDFEKQLVKEP